MKTDKLLARYADLGKGFINADKWIDTLLADLKAPVGLPATK
jgi:hypothetical protein